jgi:hypothetical protein
MTEGGASFVMPAFPAFGASDGAVEAEAEVFDEFEALAPPPPSSQAGNTATKAAMVRTIAAKLVRIRIVTESISCCIAFGVL